MTDALKVSLTFRIHSRVDELSTTENDERVEQGNNVASRLVDSEDDRALIVPGERYETFDDIESVVRVET
jgi:hypothetical protein